ncbi:MAG: recombinase family protein [Gemmataceae bacterium]
MRVALYVRVSTQRQAQTQTIDQQLERLRQVVKQKEWQLPEENVFRDDGVSGATLRRPGLDRLRDATALAKFDLILITEPDRLARNYVHQVLLLEELQRQGCRIEFTDRPLSNGRVERDGVRARHAVAAVNRLAEREVAGFTLCVAGGGFKGGTAFGETDEFGNAAVVHPLTVHDIHATLLHQLGLDHTKLTFRYNGRDQRLTDVHGEVVRGILT